jgi:threonine aldolase
MRQTGTMAACAAYALTYNFPKLVSVHALAETLEKGMREIGVDILGPAETCMVGFWPQRAMRGSHLIAGLLRSRANWHEL